MKLLFDQNISFRVVDLISETYPESQQVRLLKLENAADIEIWNYAKVNGFSIVTFDADFYDFSVLKGFPPKIIWLRTGNSTTQNIANILIDNIAIIESFEANNDLACLQIF